MRDCHEIVLLTTWFDLWCFVEFGYWWLLGVIQYPSNSYVLGVLHKWSEHGGSTCWMTSGSRLTHSAGVSQQILFNWKQWLHCYMLQLWHHGYIKVFGTWQKILWNQSGMIRNGKFLGSRCQFEICKSHLKLRFHWQDCCGRLSTFCRSPVAGGPLNPDVRTTSSEMCQMTSIDKLICLHLSTWSRFWVTCVDLNGKILGACS